MANVMNIYVAVPSAVRTQESGSCKYAPTGYGESISINQQTVAQHHVKFVSLEAELSHCKRSFFLCRHTQK